MLERSWEVAHVCTLFDTVHSLPYTGTAGSIAGAARAGEAIAGSGRERQRAESVACLQAHTVHNLRGLNEGGLTADSEVGVLPDLSRRTLPAVQRLIGRGTS